MTEGNLRVVLGDLQHVALVTEARAENQLTALVRKVLGRIERRLILANIGLKNQLILAETQRLRGLLESVDMARAVALVLVADQQHTDLQLLLRNHGLRGAVRRRRALRLRGSLRLRLCAAAATRKQESRGNQCAEHLCRLFHIILPELLFVSFLYNIFPPRSQALLKSGPRASLTASASRLPARAGRAAGIFPVDRRAYRPRAQTSRDPRRH